MGLAINNNLVYIDHSINDHLITTHANNPKINIKANPKGCIMVASIFTRLKSTSQGRKARQTKRVGDNCPLIYALKNKDNLYTNIYTIKQMLIEGRQIIKKIKFIDSKTSLICTPSSHKIVLQFANEIAKLTGAVVHKDVFVKASVQSARDDINNAISMADNYLTKKDLKQVLKNLSTASNLSMKDIPTKYRSFINPLVLVNPIFSDQIILVDDLVATGGTLICAKNLARQSQLSKDIRALSLFSDV